MFIVYQVDSSMSAVSMTSLFGRFYKMPLDQQWVQVCMDLVSLDNADVPLFQWAVNRPQDNIPFPSEKNFSVQWEKNIHILFLKKVLSKYVQYIIIYTIFYI